MTQYLPPNLLMLFAPREPIPFLPPVDKLPYRKRTAGYSGVSDYMKHFEDPNTAPPPVKIETRAEKLERRRKVKAELATYKLEQDIALWQPMKNSLATCDPFKTLFIARINYDTTETKLRREFDTYGPIRQVSIIHDRKTRKPRGYAFIEYDHEHHMRSAYKHADGKKIDRSRVLVDVERGRTVKGWLPRRLGGGLGGTRRGGPEQNLLHCGREETRLDDRYRDRDRERPERPTERRRSRSRERRRRRSRERHHGERHKRDRSRDRDRNRSRNNAEVADGNETSADVIPDVPEPTPRKERRRSRSPERERKRRRSRSRERRHKDSDSRRERNRDRSQKEDDKEQIVIKEEPIDDDIPDQPDENQENYNNNFESMGYEEDMKFTEANVENNGEEYEGY